MTIEERRPSGWTSTKSLKGEIWRPIKGFDNYEISNFGRVKSLSRVIANALRPDHILRENYAKGDYCDVHLTDNNKQVKVKRIHRLVAEAFIPNPNNYPIINHKDECTYNNHVDNLEWCTYKYNANYGNALEKKSKSLKGHRTTCDKPVCIYDLEGNFVRKFKSMASAARELGIPYAAGISATCNGRDNYIHSGYQWKFVIDGVDYTQNIGPMKTKYASLIKHVYQYDMDMNFIAEYESASKARKALGAPPKSTGICSCCRGIIPSYKKFKWFYEKQH